MWVNSKGCKTPTTSKTKSSCKPLKVNQVNTWSNLKLVISKFFLVGIDLKEKERKKERMPRIKQKFMNLVSTS